MKYLKKYIENNEDLADQILEHPHFESHLKNLLLKNLNKKEVKISFTTPKFIKYTCVIRIDFETGKLNSFYGKPINMLNVQTILENINNISNIIFNKQPQFFMGEEDIIVIYDLNINFIENNKWIVEGENLGLI